MAINEKVSNMIDDLAASGLVGSLLDLHIIERTSRIVSFTSSLIKLCRFLLVITGLIVAITNISRLLVVILYWIAAQIVIVVIDYIVNTLIIKGTFCKKPRIDFIITKDIDQTLQTTYSKYSEADMPMMTLLRIMMYTVPVYGKEPFYIAIKYLGIKSLYKFDGSLLPEDVYEHIANGVEDFSLAACDESVHHF